MSTPSDIRAMPSLWRHRRGLCAMVSSNYATPSAKTEPDPARDFSHSGPSIKVMRSPPRAGWKTRFHEDHLLRLIDRYVDLSFVRERLKALYSSTGRPSIDPEVLLRLLLVGSRWTSQLWRILGARHCGYFCGYPQGEIGLLRSTRKKCLSAKALNINAGVPLSATEFLPGTLRRQMLYPAELQARSGS